MALAVVSAFYVFATSIAQDVQNLDAFKARPTANGVIYAGDGHTVLAILRSRKENRKLVVSDQIAKIMKNATVAIEDKRFYQHGAIDPLGLARAAAVDLMTGRTQGGSTITQQFVKNVYTKGQRTLQRKLVEAVLAAQVEGAWTKDHILTEYLNTVYFGNHAYGVEEAAQIYFGVHAKTLKLYQAALLAGIVRSPTAYDPVRHPLAATTRRNEVLAAMLQQKMISPLGYATAVNTALIPYGHKVALPPASRGVAAYFTQYVERQLVARFGVARTYGGGLKVYTTIDLKMQKKARHALNTTLKQKGPAGAMVAIDPRTGQVKALVGGRDFSKQPFDIATQAQRQPGSSFKPFVLAAALEEGIQPSTTFQSRPQVISLGNGPPWVVRNDTPQYNGWIPLTTATTLSDNTVYAQLTMRVGPANVRTIAHHMGITSPLDAIPSIGLGALRLGVSPLEMAHAYATLANGGARIGGSVEFRNVAPGEVVDPSIDPISITKVLGANGKVIANNRPIVRQVIARENALEIAAILESVIRFGTAKIIKGFPRPAFGKTGTTSGFVDAWFVGSTPQLATAVWVGYVQHPTPMLTQFNGTPVFGGTLPAIAWSQFEQKALAGQPVLSFEHPVPPSAESVLIDTANGLRATPSCPRARSEVIALAQVPSAYSRCSATIVTMPDLNGMYPGNARRLVDRSGLVPRLSTIPAGPGEIPGRVVAQVPGASEPAEVGRRVSIIVARKVLHVAVPKVLGKSEAQARSALCVAGLKPVVEHSPIVGQRGAVVLQSPNALVEAPRGSAVTLEVVSGGPKVAVNLRTGCPR
ncbi:MAG: penicillin-binding protein [Gaiellales bacterium]|nr:penicillin-binding protein [Gaiellales bacterium]